MLPEAAAIVGAGEQSASGAGERTASQKLHLERMTQLYKDSGRVSIPTASWALQTEYKVVESQLLSAATLWRAEASLVGGGAEPVEDGAFTRLCSPRYLG